MDSSFDWQMLHIHVEVIVHFNKLCIVGRESVLALHINDSTLFGTLNNHRPDQ